MSIMNEFENQVRAKVADALAAMGADVAFVTELPSVDTADLAVPCFTMSKALRKAPQAIADDLAAADGVPEDHGRLLAGEDVLRPEGGAVAVAVHDVVALGPRGGLEVPRARLDVGEGALELVGVGLDGVVVVCIGVADGLVVALDETRLVGPNSVAVQEASPVLTTPTVPWLSAIVWPASIISWMYSRAYSSASFWPSGSLRSHSGWIM